MEYDYRFARVYNVHRGNKQKVFDYKGRNLLFVERGKEEPLIPGFIIPKSGRIDFNGEHMSSEVFPVMTPEKTDVTRFLRRKLREDKNPVADMDFRFWMNESEYEFPRRITTV